ncbi:putative disease resistance protein RGA3 [Phoenix dactylifera]|uniref:Disease resistance protein RGA3 n=1 Tax=Phoenix dactylifera TaxID=42345 RepID=A0A8B9AT94_PHODC|nr:putative disease resistance protein RGA3 [Phoenix dactylifera]
MADLLLSALLPVVMEKAADHVLQQFGVMWGIHEKLEKLKRQLLAIQSKLGDAEERQVKDAAVKSWLVDLKDAAYEADDILDEFNVEAMRRKAEIRIDMTKKVRSFFSLGNPVSFRLKMGRELHAIVEKIEKLVDEGNKFGFTVETQPQNRDRPQTHSYVDESEVIGREEDKEKIVKLLLDHDDNQNVAVLPIVGMGGLGKTTLAQLIYKDQRVEKHFQALLIWVCVSDEFDVAKLAKAIIASATGVQCELSDMELLQRRLREVVSGKRYFLVLDDIWNEDQAKWDELKTLLATGGEGSRIVVTTRSERASSIMGTLDTYRLPTLTEDDSWALFRKRAFAGGAEEPQNLVSIGKEIVKKCGGLPLAVKTLGGLMHSKSQEREWLSVRDSEIWGLQVGEHGILPALRLSYSDLPSHLKQCFAFCAIFPQDYEMEKDLLTQLWMANGFIPSDGRKELEDKGHEIFNELAWRSFFQDIKEAEEYGDRSYRHELYSVTTCKMHDLMHDLARSIMGNECLSILDPARWEDVSQKTRHLCTSEHFQLNIHRTLNSYPNIRTLLSSIKGFHTSITVTTDSSKPKSLRALDLHNTTITRLPIAIAYLEHLRYLDLSGTFIRAIPEAVSMLVNLQTLKLSDCGNLCKLPEDMRNMSSLRHLYIDRCSRLKQLPAGIGQLSSLRTLTKYIVGNDAGRRIGELNSLNLDGLLELYNLRNVRDAADAKEANLSSKHNLCSLILCWDLIEWYPPYCYAESAHSCFEEDVLPTENAEEVLEALRPHGGLKQLTVWRYGGGSFSTWMMDSLLLQNIIEIHLGVCTECQRLPPLWQLPFLKFLYMIKMDSIKYICSSTIYGNASDGTVRAFPSLKRLVLHTMQSLEKWSEFEGTTEVTLVFPHLAELKIIDCPNLMTVPGLPSLKSFEMEGTNKQLGLICSLTTLSSLSIGVYKTSNGTESPPLADQKKMSFRYFRSLENLAITASEDLAPLLEEEEEMRGLSSSLHYLEITHCNWFFSPSQQSSSPLAFWKNLNSLLSLRIDYCDDLVYWPEAEFCGLKSLKKINIYGCNKLVGSSPLPLSSSSSGDGELLPNLEELDIVHCDGLLELPKLSASLRSLYVGYCPKLNSLTEGLRHATSLESVDISGCPSLNSLPVDLGHLTALKMMYISELPSLKSLPQGLGQLAALKALVIKSCSKLSSLPEGMQGLTALQNLSISHCPLLSSLPEGLQRRFPGLQYLVIAGCPNLERQCKRGGPYWHLVSRIPYTEILSERRSNFSTFLPSFSCFRRPSTV